MNSIKCPKCGKEEPAFDYAHICGPVKVKTKMNGLIKEFERKCWDHQTNHLNAEKFAELIVRECANVLRVESERLYKLASEETDELFASNFEICAEKCVDNEVAIKEHFGVEE